MKKVKLFLLLLLVILLPVALIGFTDHYFSEQSGLYITERARLFSMNIITKTVNDYVADAIDMEDILLIQKNNSGMINSVVINTGQVNHILAMVGMSLDQGMKDLEKSEVWENLNIPLGILISDTLLANMGPSIHIRIRPIGSYKIDLVSQVKGYGINNSLVEVYVTVKLEVEAFIPLRVMPVVTESRIYLVSQIIKGDIPNYYYAAGTYLPNPPQREADFGNIPG